MVAAHFAAFARRARHVFCLFALLALFGHAHALSMRTIYFTPHPNNSGADLTADTPQGICDAYRAAFNWPKNWSVEGSVVVAPQSRCDYPYTNTLNGNRDVFSQYYGTRNDCPANSTKVGGQCVCKPGYKESGDMCVPDTQPDQCSANDGKVTTANYTIGWARSANTDSRDFIGALNFPNTDKAACINGCRASFDQTASADVYRSQVPSPQGLYRISGDYTMIGGNIACAPGPEDAPFNPTTPNMQCPGYVGEVNGVTVCVGNADKPIPGPEGESPKDKTGKGEAKGNPSAGQKPSTGDGSGIGGSGRTPPNGNGGNPGGPAGAAGGGTGGGTGGDGEGEGEDDKKGCGLPGQPKCAIDETGTPDGKAAYGELNGKLDGLDAQRKTGTDKIMGTGDKDTGWGTTWSWFAHGQCRPVILGTLPVGNGVDIKIDICPIVPYANLVLNFLWAVGTFLAVLEMVFRVTTKGD